MQKYVFVGNRKYVLDEMLRSQLDVCKVLIMKNSHLHNKILDYDINYEIINSKQHLIEVIENIEYDVLVSNGCQYILPISQLKKAKYINIHPSYLPDLRGLSPISGALMFERDTGATCHYMDDGIDTGEIISQVLIPYTEDLDAALLFQLCFQAEVEVFKLALNKGFLPTIKDSNTADLIYYTERFEDRLINFDEHISTILRKTNAYGYPSRGCYFDCNGITYKFFGGETLHNKFLVELSKKFKEKEVMFSYEDCIVFKKDGRIVKFFKLEKNEKNINVHDFLETCNWI